MVTCDYGREDARAWYCATQMCNITGRMGAIAVMNLPEFTVSAPW